MKVEIVCSKKTRARNPGNGWKVLKSLTSLMRHAIVPKIIGTIFALCVFSFPYYLIHIYFF